MFESHRSIQRHLKAVEPEDRNHSKDQEQDDPHDRVINRSAGFKEAGIKAQVEDLQQDQGNDQQEYPRSLFEAGTEMGKITAEDHPQVGIVLPCNGKRRAVRGAGGEDGDTAKPCQQADKEPFADQGSEPVDKGIPCDVSGTVVFSLLSQSAPSTL